MNRMTRGTTGDKRGLGLLRAARDCLAKRGSTPVAR
jgi:hypothetical protein